ncbi:MAG: hypothetical protein WKF32_00370 [Thermoleophilaceae bacterium]
MTDVVWSRSPAFKQRRTRALLVGARMSNLAMVADFAWRSREAR